MVMKLSIYIFMTRNMRKFPKQKHCLLYTSDAADERSSVDLGGRRIIKKKNNDEYACAYIGSQTNN